ncbi:AMP-binding protein, partial [Streptomyces sp. NPDC052196]|uniref:AMP-binding protein n=1 Tax=Streptomyces sp. NPDC052196 TaxID=3156691 RepID=UPI00343DAB5F
MDIEEPMTPDPLTPRLPHRTMYQWFEESALRLPGHTALEIGDEVLTYAELRRLALVLAARVVRKHGGVPDRVALVAARSVGAYAGYLAIQRLGAAVVPLNPDHPQQRNLDVAQRAGVTVALVEERAAELFARLPERHRPTVLELTEDERAEDDLLEEALEEALPPVPSDLAREAYILFTSGSTGQPKGVPILHRHFSPYLEHNIPRYEIAPGSRLSQVFGLTFDAHAFDLFAAWGGGATVVVPSATDLYTPVDFIVERKLTHWFSVPSVVREAQRLGNLPLGRCVTLKHSLFGAEPVTAQHAALWHEVAPHSQF